MLGVTTTVISQNLVGAHPTIGTPEGIAQDQAENPQIAAVPSLAQRSSSRRRWQCENLNSPDRQATRQLGNMLYCFRRPDTYYTLNPEGLGVHLKFTTSVTDKNGRYWSAQSNKPRWSVLDGDSEELGLTVAFKHQNGTIFRVFRGTGRNGETISDATIGGGSGRNLWDADVNRNPIFMSDLMMLAGTSLDHLAPGAKNLGEKVVNRLTGLPLKVKVEISNFNAYATHGVHMETNFWGIHDPVAIITVSRESVWSILGSKTSQNIADVTNNHGISCGGGWSGIPRLLDAMPQYWNGTSVAWGMCSNQYSERFDNFLGIKLRFEYSGSWGFFSLFYFINTLIQGLILLGES